jgi:hypothetical protein
MNLGSDLTVRVRVDLANPEALDDLLTLRECLEDLADAMPWRPEVRAALEAAERMARGLHISTPRP